MTYCEKILAQVIFLRVMNGLIAMIFGLSGIMEGT